MPILLLFYLILTALPLPWPAPQFGLGLRGTSALTLALATAPIVVAWWLGRRACHRLVAEPGRREEVLTRFSRGKQFQLYGLMAAHVLALSLGWGWAVPL